MERNRTVPAGAPRRVASGRVLGLRCSLRRGGPAPGRWEMARPGSLSDVDRQELEEGGRPGPRPQRAVAGRTARCAPGRRALDPVERGVQPAQDQVSQAGPGPIGPEAAWSDELRACAEITFLNPREKRV